MKSIIKFEEFSKFVFKIDEISKDSITKLNLEAKPKEQIVVSSVEGKLIIPLVNGKILLVPEKKVENGTKLS